MSIIVLYNSYCSKLFQKISKTSKNVVHFKKLLFSNHAKTTTGTSFNYSESEEIEFDYEYLCNEANRLEIKRNIVSRKKVGDIDKLQTIWKQLQEKSLTECMRDSLEKELRHEASLIPNKSSPHLLTYGKTPKVLKSVNEKPTFNFKPSTFMALTEKLQLLKGQGDNTLKVFTGPGTYYLKGALAELEQALVRYTVSHLLSKGFTLLSVPDILYDKVIERCGMPTRDELSQIYHVSNAGHPLCLSGTAEMAIGGMLQNQSFDLNSLPLKFAAVSRCFRREGPHLSHEKGIYRVHAFTKVEMFGVTAAESGEESNQLYKELIDTQIELYSPLGFQFEVLDMPLPELGAPAYTKTDIEAWIPVQKVYGEISSSSNCLDYQSRRLKIQYKDASGNVKFAHTVNGTAGAIPRLLIALVTSNQTNRGEINIPEVLRPLMNNWVKITKEPNCLPANIFKNKSYSGTIV